MIGTASDSAIAEAHMIRHWALNWQAIALHMGLGIGARALLRDFGVFTVVCIDV